MEERRITGLNEGRTLEFREFLGESNSETFREPGEAVEQSFLPRNTSTTPTFGSLA